LILTIKTSLRKFSFYPLSTLLCESFVFSRSNAFQPIESWPHKTDRR